MINTLKNSSIPADVGMCFSRITHKRTYDMYGQLDQVQTGQALNSNKRLKKNSQSSVQLTRPQSAGTKIEKCWKQSVETPLIAAARFFSTVAQ